MIHNLYLLHNKNEILDAFKIFIARSDIGEEYYGRYIKNGQAPGLFAKFLRENEMVSQYIMFGSPDQNGVAEIRNRTLLDLVWSTLRNSNISKSLRTEALKMTVYILNWVPTNVVPKTSFELLKGWKLGLQHVRV